MTPIATNTNSNQNFKNSNQEFLGNGSDSASSATRNLRDTSAKVEGKVLGFIGSAREKISHVSDTVTQEIHSNPVQSTLVVLGAGYLLSVLLRR